MTTTTPTSVDILAAMLARLVNGEGLPPPEGRQFEAFKDAMGDLVNTKRPADVERLGHHAIDLLISAARAKIAADKVLRNFGSGSFDDR